MYKLLDYPNRETNCFVPVLTAVAQKICYVLEFVKLMSTVNFITLLLFRSCFDRRVMKRLLGYRNKRGTNSE